MISKLIIALLNLIQRVVAIIMFPLDALVTALVPDLSDTINSISTYLMLPGQYMGWIFELLHVPQACLLMIISYWVFKYAIIGATAGIKTVITLYRRFKL